MKKISIGITALFLCVSVAFPSGVQAQLATAKPSSSNTTTLIAQVHNILTGLRVLTQTLAANPDLATPAMLAQIQSVATQAGFIFGNITQISAGRVIGNQLVTPRYSSKLRPQDLLAFEVRGNPLYNIYISVVTKNPFSTSTPPIKQGGGIQVPLSWIDEIVRLYYGGDIEQFWYELSLTPNGSVPPSLYGPAQTVVDLYFVKGTTVDDVQGIARYYIPPFCSYFHFSHTCSSIGP